MSAPEPDGIPLARYLAEAGLTHAEIAAELGMTEAQVARLPELAGVDLGPPHVARIERSMYREAVSGNVSAAKLLLPVHDRRYSAEAAPAQGARTVINLIASDPVRVARMRELLGLTPHDSIADGSPLSLPPAEG